MSEIVYSASMIARAEDGPEAAALAKSDVEHGRTYFITSTGRLAFVDGAGSVTFADEAALTHSGDTA